MPFNWVDHQTPLNKATLEAFEAEIIAAVQAIVGGGSIGGTPTGSDGGYQIGDVLTSEGPATGVTYQWYRDQVPIPGATGRFYTITADDVDTTHQITSSWSAVVVVGPAPQTPAAPSNFTAVNGTTGTDVQISWTPPPGPDGGDAGITGYTFTRTPSGGATVTSQLIMANLVAQSDGTYTFTSVGLTTGTSYTFTLAASNAAGLGAAASATVTPTAPSTIAAPTGLTASNGDGQATITWTPPAGANYASPWPEYSINGGTTYIVLASPVVNGNGTWSALILGLTNGTAYTLLLRHKNGAGVPGATASVTLSPVAAGSAPSAPTGLTVTAGNASATGVFTPAGTAATSWEYSINGGTSYQALTTAAGTGSTRTFSLTGLTNNTAYTVKVRGINGFGTGPAATSSSFTPQAPAFVPGAPTGLSASSGEDSQSTLTFTPPGGAVSFYQYAIGPTYATWTTKATTSGSGGAQTMVVTGLSNGTGYTFKVRAVNTVGTGAASSASSTATPNASTPVTPGSGIWVSSSRISALPTSGTAWSNLSSDATSSWGAPAVGDQDNDHGVLTMSGALYYAKTGTATMRDKVRTAIAAVQGTEATGPYGTYQSYGAPRALALGRNILAYVIAADLIDLKTYDSAANNTFRTWLHDVIRYPTVNGPTSVIDCHNVRPNNWGTWCGASRIAADIYLGDTGDLNLATAVFKGYIGDRSSYSKFSYGNLAYQANESLPVGINAAGTTKSISGGTRNVDGIIPDDMRRVLATATSPPVWPVPYTNYIMEAHEGICAQALLLENNGTTIWTLQSSAIKRAHEWYFNVANFAGNTPSNHQLTPWIINKVYATSYPTATPSIGKGFGYTDWTHQ